MTSMADTSGRVFVRHKLAFPVQVDRDTLDALPSAWHIAMYVTLLRLAQAENNSAPGFKALAKQARMSVGKASAVLNDLERQGVIVRTRTRLPSGLDYRTNYEILGVQDMNTAVQDMNPVHPMNAVHDTNSGDLQGGSPHEHHVVVAPPSKKEQQQGLLALLKLGVSRVVAEHLIADRPAEVVRQLEALPRRAGVRDPAATVVKAIKDEWAAPAMPVTEPAAAPPVPRCDQCSDVATTAYRDVPMCEDCAARAKADAEYDGPCRACGGTGQIDLAGRKLKCPVGCERQPEPVA